MKNKNFESDAGVDGVPYGVSPSKEKWVPLRDGRFFVFPSKGEGAGYVRIVNQYGGEVAYWDSTEWEEQPEIVMGAICGAMISVDNVKGPDYYIFAIDAVLPPMRDLIMIQARANFPGEPLKLRKIGLRHVLFVGNHRYSVERESKENFYFVPDE